MGPDDYLQRMAVISHYKKLFFFLSGYYTMRQRQETGGAVERSCRDLKTFSLNALSKA